ncbi:hypothetical protein FRB94_013049 [Tulasnella sp. JGI-2019a]|nr:hypothetical protein FRB93_001871 [Tulasnella sp. JGI-2019a]KAG9008642.1 hypothetical protein FRB94_013049 [Tulasnella sp. JGI-2019a]KAG9033833.1 hypothetical protein FRB95_014155 [Tulasnella sp. JGI-2019a]
MAARAIPGFYYDIEKKRYFPGKDPRGISSNRLNAQPTFIGVAQDSDASTLSGSRSIFSCLSAIKASKTDTAIRTNLLRQMRNAGYSSTKSSHSIGVVSHRSCRLTAMAVSSENQAFICGDSFGCINFCRPVVGSFLDMPGVPPTQHYAWNQEMVLASEISSTQCIGNRYIATSFGPQPKILTGVFSEGSESGHPTICSIISSSLIQDIWDSHFDGHSVCLAIKGGIAHIENLERPTVEVHETGNDAMAISRRESCVYAGLRDGRVFRSDLRMSTQGHDMLPEVNSLPVTKVSLPRESELFLARMNGDLYLYDLRMTSPKRGLPVIRKYEGHVNTHTRRIGICHDPDGEYLFAAGEDGHVRGWNMRTGHHLDTPPVAVDGESESNHLLGPHFNSPAVAMHMTRRGGESLIHVAFADKIKSFQLGMRHWASEGI